MMSSNKRFTNRVTRSVLEIRSPHFYTRPSQAQTVQKRSGFVFPSTDRVTWLVNRYDYFSYVKIYTSGPAEAVRPLRPWSDQNFDICSQSLIFSKFWSDQ